MDNWSDVLKSKKFWASLIFSLILKELITRLSVLSSSAALTLWGRLLQIITLGSTAVRDAPYAAAALNPYPMPALMLTSTLFLLFLHGVSS